MVLQKGGRALMYFLCFRVISFMDVEFCLEVVCSVKVIHVQNESLLMDLVSISSSQRLGFGFRKMEASMNNLDSLFWL